MLNLLEIVHIALQLERLRAGNVSLSLVWHILQHTRLSAPQEVAFFSLCPFRKHTRGVTVCRKAHRQFALSIEKIHLSTRRGFAFHFSLIRDLIIYTRISKLWVCVCFIQLGRIVLIAGELCNVRSSRGCGIALRPIFTPREPARRARKMREIYNVRALARSFTLTHCCCCWLHSCACNLAKLSKRLDAKTPKCVRVTPCRLAWSTAF